MRSLLDIMLITGVIHGGTLSMTRLFGKPEFYRWRNIDEKEWNETGEAFLTRTRTRTRARLAP